MSIIVYRWRSAWISRLSFCMIWAFVAVLANPAQGKLNTMGLNPSEGLLIDSPHNDGDAMRFIYEAVASGKFGVIETTTDMGLSGPDGWLPKAIVRRYEFATDFGLCANTPTQTRGFIGVAIDDTVELFTYSPYAFDEALLKGQCLVSRIVSQPQANWLLKRAAASPVIVTDKENNIAVREVPNAYRGDDLWAVFGLERYNATQWDATGTYRRPDRVTADELVRALGSSIHMQNAALRVLSERLDTNGIMGTGILFREVRPTHPKVLDALLTSGLLEDSNAYRRAYALRALAAIGGDAEYVLPAIIAALKSDVIDQPVSEAELKHQERVANLLPGAEKLFASRLPRPGADDRAVLPSASLAIFRTYSPFAADYFIEHFDAEIEYHLRSSSSSSISGLILAIAGASNSEGLVMDLLHKLDAQPPAFRKNVQAIIATMNSIPPAIVGEVRERCGFGTSSEKSVLDSLFCDVQFAKLGDSGAMDRIEKRLSPGPYQQFNAAFSLLFDLGKMGGRRLREIAISENEVAARIALIPLCHLGPDAGEGISVRARQLVDEFPEDDRLQRVAKWCDASERTMLGRFFPAS